MTAPQTSPAPAGPWTILFRRLRRNRVATVGGWILLVLYAAACFAGFIAPYRYDDADRDSSKAGPALFGNFVHVSEELDSEEEPGTRVTVWARTWKWFRGGVHFRGPDGALTWRPHVHPLVEKKFTDEYGDTSYVAAAADTSVSLPVEFFVDGPEHEVFSLLGLFPVKGTTHLFGVRRPDGFRGVARIYLLGSDPQGRDVFSRLLYGAQVSLSVGVLGIAVSMSLGMLIGGISGYVRGATDFVVMRVVEVILSVPSLYLIIVLGGFLQRWETADGRPLSSRQTYLMIVGILAFIGWATTSRVIRGMVLSLREMDYVTSARALGIPAWRVIVRHILPNTFSYAIVTATLYVPYYILGEVALSYLGLGIQEPEASWGNMLRDAQQATYLQENPWVVLPGVFIFLAVLAYNFLGDGLRDAADPRVVLLKKKD